MGMLPLNSCQLVVLLQVQGIHEKGKIEKSVCGGPCNSCKNEVEPSLSDQARRSRCNSTTDNIGRRQMMLILEGKVEIMPVSVQAKQVAGTLRMRRKSGCCRINLMIGKATHWEQTGWELIPQSLQLRRERLNLIWFCWQTGSLTKRKLEMESNTLDTKSETGQCIPWSNAAVNSCAQSPVQRGSTA